MWLLWNTKLFALMNHTQPRPQTLRVLELILPLAEGIEDWKWTAPFIKHQVVTRVEIRLPSSCCIFWKGSRFLVPHKAYTQARETKPCFSKSSCLIQVFAVSIYMFGDFVVIAAIFVFIMSFTIFLWKKRLYFVLLFFPRLYDCYYVSFLADLPSTILFCNQLKT